jgi:hypothetical protein
MATKKYNRKSNLRSKKQRKNPRKLFTLKKGGLIKYGYSLKDGRNTRINALKKAVKHIPYKSMVGKLNVLTILHKNTNPIYSRRARHDLEWIQKHRK